MFSGLQNLTIEFAGLIDSDWGGTPIEAWSSVDALSQCNKQKKVTVSDDDNRYNFYQV